MPNPLVVIKLGGAAITDKSRIYTPRMTALHSAARQIGAIGKKRAIILVHGAGSFGHIPVKNYDLATGYRNPSQLNGLSKAKFQLLKLESIINEIFLQHNVPIVPFTTSSYTVARKGRIIDCNVRSIMTWIKLGCIPSTGGDIVPDVSTGFSIVSGDQIAAYLAVKLNAKMLIFATDVDGIFNIDPRSGKHARLMREIDVSKICNIKTATSSAVVDVTRGMSGKLEEAAIAATNGIPVYFVNLHKSNRVKDLALGRRVICTKLVQK